MRLPLFIINGLVFLSLIIFDIYSFNQVSQKVFVIDQLSVLLDIRGRQRFESQQHYIDRLEATNQEERIRISDAFLKSRLFSAKAELSLLEPVRAWPQIKVLQAKRKQLEQVKEDYRVHAENHELSNEDVLDWSLDLVDILDDIKRLDVQLSQFLTDQVDQTLRETVFINSVVLCLIFTLTLMIVHKIQARELLDKQTFADELKERQAQLQSSQTVMMSLMEDLSSEKDSATALSEQLLLTNEEMKQKNDELEQFIYTVSHDLKSPLVSIAGFTQKLQSELSNTLTDKQAHRFNRICSNVEHMESLLKDLLQLSRVIHQDIEIVEIDTQSVLDQQLSILGEQIITSGADITVDRPLLPISANSRLLSECLLNLLSNAINYRSPERKLEIKIKTQDCGDERILSIEDNGIGIDAKYHQKIFKIFERLDEGDGSGVGLTIVKSVMEKHGGQVLLESSLGQGSVFTLKFPVKPKQTISRPSS